MAGQFLLTVQTFKLSTPNSETIQQIIPMEKAEQYIVIMGQIYTH